MGLEPMECLGKPFDPNFHHAIELVATEDAEDQTVFDELQKGYLFKGRLLRPAMVRVATRS
jgi:molecular chaperone GrpE